MKKLIYKPKEENKYSNKNYIFIDLDTQWVLSSGINLEDFFKYNNCNIENIILLDSEVCGNDYNNKHNFHTIKGKTNINTILNPEDICFGNLTFVDCKYLQNVDGLTLEQIFHILYFSHCYKKLKYLFENSLNNNYAYYSHDDGWHTEVYCRNIEDYIILLINLFYGKLGGQNNEYNRNLIKKLKDIFSKGIIIEFLKDKIMLYEIGYYRDVDYVINNYYNIEHNNSYIKHEVTIKNNEMNIS